MHGTNTCEVRVITGEDHVTLTPSTLTESNEQWANTPIIAHDMPVSRC